MVAPEPAGGRAGEQRHPVTLREDMVEDARGALQFAPLNDAEFGPRCCAEEVQIVRNVPIQVGMELPFPTAVAGLRTPFLDCTARHGSVLGVAHVARLWLVLRPEFCAPPAQSS